MQKLINIEKYLNEEVDYSKDFADPEFGIIYDKHKAKQYLKNITEDMLAELGVKDYNEKQYNCFKGWVYMFGNTISEKESQREKIKSDELKELIKKQQGNKIKLKIKGVNLLGYSNVKEELYKVIANANNTFFLMPPHARRKGLRLDEITVLEIINK